MTSIYFVRHAQPDGTWLDDRTKPLTTQGLKERQKVTFLLSTLPINAFFSSPYKRSIDTISECAKSFHMEIHTDERFRERQSGINDTVDLLERRWDDFNFCEDGGESLSSVQLRNIEVLSEILCDYKNNNIVIGTHGTALSTILNHFDPSFGCDDFKRIWHCMPYIVQFNFNNRTTGNGENLFCQIFKPKNENSYGFQRYH